MSKSLGVWLLAWRRFERDRLGLACLVVVLIYAAVMVACAAGWIVRDWSEEVAVTYAPPTFLGPEAPRGAPAAAAETAPQAALEDYGIPDPLADDLAEIARELAGTSATETRAATLAFGADKWGRDVLKKGDTARVSFSYVPPNNYPKSPALVYVEAAPLNKVFSFTLVFDTDAPLSA